MISTTHKNTRHHFTTNISFWIKTLTEHYCTCSFCRWLSLSLMVFLFKFNLKTYIYLSIYLYIYICMSGRKENECCFSNNSSQCAFSVKTLFICISLNKQLIKCMKLHILITQNILCLNTRKFLLQFKH